MKRISAILMLAVVIVLLSGCLTTLHPIFEESDLVYKTELLGKWKTSGSDGGWAEISPLANETNIEMPGKISSIKHKGYLVTYKKDDGEADRSYIAFLARIGSHLYFDYYPVPSATEKKGDEFYMIHFVKMHTPYRVELLKNGGFELSQLESNFLEKLIQEKKIRISHEKTLDGQVIITASTAELKQYILKYGDNPEAVRSDKTKFSKLVNL